MHPSNFTDGQFQGTHKRCEHGVWFSSACSICSSKSAAGPDSQLSKNEIKRLRSINSLAQLDEPEIITESADQVMSRKQRRR